MRALVLLFAATAFAGCSSGDSSPGDPIVVPPPINDPVFVYRGLEGQTVVALAQTDTSVLAGTTRGIYRYDGGTDWTLTTPADWSVTALEALNPTRLLAAVDVSGTERHIVESLDAGNTWNVVQNDFGGSLLQPREPVFRMAFDESSGELLATGYGALARSADFGRTWTVLNGQWGVVSTGLSALSKADLRGDIWYGGQGALEDPVLIRYSPNSGQSVNLSAAIETILPRPSTVESIRFYPTAEDIVFVVGEGGIAVSSDYGANWRASLTNTRARFYFDLIIDEPTGAVYSAGWDKNFTDPQPLILDISLNGGQSWQSYQHDDSSILGGVWSMRLVDLNDRRRLFLGLQGGGVYEVDLDAMD
ncbi:MAG: hypothetical protein AAFY56_13665 [Pseudomonadota bacterium]